jgi:acyl-CoA thioester hydrolase
VSGVYIREIHYPGRVRIGTCVARIGRSSITVEQALFQGDVCFATSRGVMVMLDHATRRPAELPAALRAGFAALAPIGEAT